MKAFLGRSARARWLSLGLGAAVILGMVLDYVVIRPLSPLGPSARAGSAQMHDLPVHHGTIKGSGGGSVRSDKPVPPPSAADLQSLHDRQEALRATDARILTLPHVPDVHEANPGPAAPKPSTQPRTGCGNTCFDFANLTLPPVSLPGSGSIPLSPSAAAHGKHILTVGNFFAKISHDNGVSWFDGLPATVFEPNAEHNQVIYEPSRNVFLWEIEGWAGYGNPANEITLVVVNGQINGYCSYHITPTAMGMPVGTTLEWSQIATGTDYAYISFVAINGNNTFLTSGIVRLDLTAISAIGACPNSVSIGTTTDNSVWLYNVTDGDTDTAYFGSSWFVNGSGFTGNHLRLLFWKESSSTPNVGTFAIDPFIPYGYGQADCSSEDATIGNWCFRSATFEGTGYRSRAGYKGRGSPLLAFAFPAQKNPGSGLPHPYIVREYFNLYNVTYTGHENVFSAVVSYAFPAMTVTSARGYAGGTYTYGGGTNAGGNSYPGSILFIEDPINNGPYGNFATTSGSNGWGTYGWSNSAHQLSPDGYHIIAAIYFFDGAGNAFPVIWEFGEQRDHPEYLRWANA